jgi:hypothetical protein
MLIVLTLLFISLIAVPCLAYQNDRNEVIPWTTMINCIVAIILIAIWSVSYVSYVNMRQYTANFNTHADTIASYEKLAVLDTETSPITDLKYQNYQRSIKDLVEDLKRSCIAYNDIFASKTVLGNNIIFSWLIIMPDDDMKIVKFSDFLDVRNR